MSNIELREYQKRQLQFLQRNNGLIKGLQSPTGTGKSIVILSYIKECIEKELYKTIVLSTGFNELVFQIADDAKMLGLEPKVIIGSGHLIPNCDKRCNYAPDFKVSKNLLNICSNCPINSKRRKINRNICSKKCIMDYLKSSKQKFIITNHSYFLAMKNIINADCVVIDEAHTFNDFYMSFNTVYLTKEEKEILTDYCENVNSPASKILKFSLEKGLGINENLLSSVAEELKSYLENSDFEIYSFIEKLKNIFSKKSFENFLEEKDGEFIKTNFFSKYDVNSEGKRPDVIITSATLDKYTLKMFGCTNKNQVYNQTEYRYRYKGSYFVTDYSDYKVGFPKSYEKTINKYGYKNGLILCTSNESVRWTINFIQENIKDIKVFSSANDFKNSNAEKKVLVGSKKFFQGINITDLDYVIMDKLPFSPYDDKFKAYSYYIEKTIREDAWTGYTLPLMFNALLQGMGRLWRKNDIENNIYDQGLFMIFDPRLEKKFNYIEKDIVKMKPGISLIKCVAGEEYVEEEKKVTKIRKRKILNQEPTNAEYDEEISEQIKKSETDIY